MYRSGEVGAEGQIATPVGVEGEHVEDDLDDGHPNPDRHEQGNHLVAPGMSVVQEPHDNAELS